MSWSAGPSLAGFEAFLANYMQIAPQYLPISIPAPAIPLLTAGSAGSLPTETVYVTITYTSTAGETIASAAASVGVTGATGSVSVASPALVPGATGWNVYAANAAGTEVLQNATPQAVGTAYVITALTTGTPAAPAINTAGSPWPSYAYNRALALVIQIACIPGAEYTGAVYNCGGAIVITIAPDQPQRKFFEEQRKAYGLLTFAAGVVQATADQSTSTTLAVPDALAQLTIEDLQFARTPWGREYLSYQQSYGPTVWGLT